MNISKPIILYSMPRTRSTAILRSCYKLQKLHEPFDNYSLFGTNLDIMKMGKDWQKNVDVEKWQSIKRRMNNPLSVSKFFGHSLWFYDPAAEWFRQVDFDQTHTIYVVTRDLREVCWSYMLAFYFGWDSASGKDPYRITVNSDIPKRLDFVLRCFLDFLPRNAQLLDWDNLPEDHFDKSMNTLQDQESQSKLEWVRNRAWCEHQIDYLVKKYQQEFDLRVYTLPWA